MSVHPAAEPNEWIWRSEYDIETAEAMLKSGRYLYVVFCCQQAIEKRFKAIIAEKTGEMPPKIHDLTRLAQRAEISVSSPQALFLEQLNIYYIEGRYPEEVSQLMEQMDKSLAGRILKETREFILWLVPQKN